jgi:hypothetical protein
MSAVPSIAATPLISEAILPAIDRWMPRRMLEAEIPRDTMLITSVSASTAQIDETFSGESPCWDRVPISSWAIPR